MVYSIHMDDSIIKEAEKRQNEILDADYSKVKIPAMVVELDISDASKKKLQTMLEKFSEPFGGGLGRIKWMQPASIKLKPGSKPYASRYYNFPKAYEIPAKKDIKRMVQIDVLKRFPWNANLPWCAPTFGVTKKTGDIRIVTDF